MPVPAVAASTLRRILADIVQFRAKRYLGHNPAGGAAVIIGQLREIEADALTGEILKDEAD